MRMGHPITVWVLRVLWAIPYAYGQKYAYGTEQAIHADLMMELYSLIVLLIAVIVAQRSRACAPNCASVTSNHVVRKTIDRVVVSGVEEAQWRGMCHSLCINVS